MQASQTCSFCHHTCNEGAKLLHFKNLYSREFFFLSLTHLSFVFNKSLVFKRIECVIRLSCYCYRVRLVSGFAVQVQRTSFFTTILI